MKRDPSYETGFDDGLRLAVEIVRDLEGVMSARFTRGGGRKTQEQRQVRIRAYRVAGTRISTRLKARVRQRRSSLAATVEELAL